MNKVLKLLTHEIYIVSMLGIISVTTAWAGVQSSLHSGAADEAYSVYQLDLNESNNMWITSEVKYRADLTVWKDKQVRLLIDGVSTDDIYSDLQTANGSYEFFVYAHDCLIAQPQSYLPDCTPYMDELYVPQAEVWEMANESLVVSETESGHSDRLQLLTALLAVSLFMLGIASVVKRKELLAPLVILATSLWVFGCIVILNVPVIAVG
jgi:hypothetical protein